MIPPNGNRIPSLDGLRAISIILVVIGHAVNTLPDVTPLGRQLFLFLGNGHLGVSIFFVISGFLITRLLVQEFKGTGTVSIKNFYIRRTLRIWPPFYILIGCVCLLGFSHVIKLKPMEVISASLFFWNYYPNGTTWFLGHTWSLALEEQFYLIWPVLLITLKLRKAAWFSLAVILSEPLIRVLNYTLAPSARSHIPIMLHTRADTLMVGALAALMLDNESFRRRVSLALQFKSHILGVFFLLILDPLLEQRFHGTYSLIIGWSVANLAIGIVLLWLVLEPGTAVGQIVNSRFVCHIGLISYSLYLWQQVFLTRENIYLGTFPLNVLCAIAAAEASYWLVEQPVWRLRQKFVNPAGSASTSGILGVTKTSPTNA